MSVHLCVVCVHMCLCIGCTCIVFWLLFVCMCRGQGDNLGDIPQELSTFLSFSRFVFILCVCVFACMYVSVCPMCVPGDCRGQKRISDPPEIELHIIVSCHVGAGLNLDPLPEWQVSFTAEL